MIIIALFSYLIKIQTLPTKCVHAHYTNVQFNFLVEVIIFIEIKCMYHKREYDFDVSHTIAKRFTVG